MKPGAADAAAWPAIAPLGAEPARGGAAVDAKAKAEATRPGGLAAGPAVTEPPHPTPPAARSVGAGSATARPSPARTAAAAAADEAGTAPAAVDPARPDLGESVPPTATTSATTRATAAAWRAALATLAVLLPALVWLYRDTAAAMVAIWSRSDTFAHAYTVPPLVGWLIWRQRHALAARPPRPAPWLLLPIAAAAFVWLVGDVAAANALAQLAFVALLVLAFVAVAGTQAAGRVAFPLCFLFFAVPIGEFLMPQLMVWTADFTVQALRLSGIPVYREGLQFVIPTGNWSVVEACSGVRYLIASFMVGTLFAYLNYRSLRRRLLFAVVSLAVPVVANWLRAYGIVMLGHLSNNRLAAGADHLLYGWVFFGVVIVLMFMIGARWAEEPDDRLAPAPGGRQPVRPALPGGDAAPLPAGGAARRWRAPAAVALAGWLLAAAPPFAFRAIDQPAAAGAPPPLLAAPAALAADWRLAADRGFTFQPAFDGADAAVNAAYRSPRGEVGVFVGYYRRQTYAHKLVSSENVLVTPRDTVWAVVGQGAVDGSGAATSWRRTLLQARAPTASAVPERLHAWQLYWVNGRFTASDTWARAFSAADRLLGRGDDAAVIVLYVPSTNLQSDTQRAETLLHGFAGTTLPAIDAWLRGTRAASAARNPP